MYRARAAVRSGVLKFADGGGLYHKGKDYIVNASGKRYASERAAENAVLSLATATAKTLATAPIRVGKFGRSERSSPRTRALLVVGVVRLVHDRGTGPAVVGAVSVAARRRCRSATRRGAAAGGS